MAQAKRAMPWSAAARAAVRTVAKAPPSLAAGLAAREDRTMPVYYYDPPDRFVVGSVGQPGDRTVCLQAASSGPVTRVVLEKFPVNLLTERNDELLHPLLGR